MRLLHFLKISIYEVLNLLGLKIIATNAWNWMKNSIMLSVNGRVILSHRFSYICIHLLKMIFIERSWSVIGFALRLSREIIQIDKNPFPGVSELRRIEIFSAYCNFSHLNYVDNNKMNCAAKSHSKNNQKIQFLQHTSKLNERFIWILFWLSLKSVYPKQSFILIFKLEQINIDTLKIHLNPYYLCPLNDKHRGNPASKRVKASWFEHLLSQRVTFKCQ